jgi:hypothetical protein
LAEGLASVQFTLGRIGDHLRLSDARQDETVRVLGEVVATVETLRREVERISGGHAPPLPPLAVIPSRSPRRGLILATSAGALALAGWLVANWRNLVGMLRYLADALLRLPPPPPPAA